MIGAVMISGTHRYDCLEKSARPIRFLGPSTWERIYCVGLLGFQWCLQQLQNSQLGSKTEFGVSFNLLLWWDF